MMPIVLNTPEPMVRVRVVTVKDFSDRTLKVLQEIGVLHVEEAKEFDPVNKAAIESESHKVRESLSYCNDILNYLPGKREALPLEAMKLKSYDEIAEELRTLHGRFVHLYQKTISLQEEIGCLGELGKYLNFLSPQVKSRLGDLNYSGGYLFSRVLVLSGEAHQLFREKANEYLFQDIAVAVEDEVVDYIIARVKNQRTIEDLVQSLGARALRIPEEDLTLDEFLKGINDKIRSRQDELAGLQEDIQSMITDNLEEIVLLQEVLAAENDRLSVLEKACETKHVTLIEGWVPESNLDTASSELKETIGYIFIDTSKPEPIEEPPVKLRNPQGIKPFEVITSLFGTPRYREWDPTPIIAYSFAFFFGLMVGDLFYGLGIILVARYVLKRLVDNPESQGFLLFQRLLYTSGSVALIIGLLTGTYLGDIFEFVGIPGSSLALVGELRAVLMEPLSFIILSLVIGIIHVNIAHVLALIKAVRERQKGVILNKAGLFTLQIAGIPYITHSLLSVDILPLGTSVYPILLYVVLASVVLIVVANFMQRGPSGSVFWIFDITGLLGDVMSYARIAGVGLATFYLASVFNMMAGLVLEILPGVAGIVLGGIIAVVILVLGHLLNLFLSALTGFIHSLRLCFVEFLFKFYEGGGRVYEPFQLRRRGIVVVRG